MTLSTRLLAALLAAALAATVPAVATASIQHPRVVSDNPANDTPVLVDDGSGKPRVDALDKAGPTIYAGGRFNRVADSKSNGGQVLRRANIMAIDADTKRVRTGFDPVVDGTVWDVEATVSGVFVAGQFATVNGVSRPALARLDPRTGAVDRGFDARFNGGRIEEVDLVDGRLVVAGRSGRKLMALNPVTGRDTGYIDVRISDQLPGSRGGVGIFDFAVHPDGTQLIASGNFQTVAGRPRSKFFVLDLGRSRATLDPWYYRPFVEKCQSTGPRRIAYLQGVDYSPSGRHFAITATGQIPYGEDRGKTVCDATGYFDLTDDSAPEWINYTGGDSVWSTAVTGAAVYVQGHFSWLDNTNGSKSQCPQRDLDVCDARKGVGAINPATGQALPWDPHKPAQIGGKDFLVTVSGLWIGSDSRRINGEPRRGLAFMPLG